MSYCWPIKRGQADFVPLREDRQTLLHCWPTEGDRQTLLHCGHQERRDKLCYIVDIRKGQTYFVTLWTSGQDWHTLLRCWLFRRRQTDFVTLLTNRRGQTDLGTLLTNQEKTGKFCYIIDQQKRTKLGKACLYNSIWQN